MPAQPISFTGRLSLQEALDLVRYRALRQVRPAIRWLIGIVSFLIAALCILVSLQVKFNPATAFFLLLCAYFPIGWWYHALWSARWHYRRHPELYHKNTVTIDDESVSVENVNVSLRLKWNQFSFLLDTSKGIMFVLPNVQVLCWLPQRLFEGNQSKEEILAYTKVNNIPVRFMK